ncbi:MAG: class I SAM-dependent methyltransferase [Sphingomonadaceae bacterium]|nr:class I SAM-dependent methyltransferase [Sphingomonadaceae bacterium]
MKRQPAAAFFAAAALLLGGAAAAALAQRSGSAAARQGALAAAIAAPSRTPANVARDRYRHPLETLSFFGVRPSDTLVEIWPSGGWYTEVLAPYLARGGGRYYAASMGTNGNDGMRRMMAANPALYGAIVPVAFPAWEPSEPRVPDGSADVVLTFRNVHNWLVGYRRDRHPYAEEAFRQMFAMLRPGGTLGIEDHRLPEGADPAREGSSGYVKVSTVRRLAEAAGFRFVGASEINANPRDTADWPEGVWTLPPTYQLGDRDRARYAAIGESDRMTLRFVKPAAPLTRRRR